MELGAAFFTRLHVASDAAVPMEFAKELTTLAKETSQKFNSSTSPIIGGNNSTNYGSEAPALSTAPRTTTDPPCDYHTPTFAIPDQSEVRLLSSAVAYALGDRYTDLFSFFFHAGHGQPRRAGLARL